MLLLLLLPVLLSAFVGCGSAREANVLDSIAVTETALDYLESIEGRLILVVSSKVEPNLRSVLDRAAETVTPAQLETDEDRIPKGYVLFEGLLVEGDYAEFGARVGPIDPETAPCGTKYRLIMDRRNSVWALRQYFIGGC